MSFPVDTSSESRFTLAVDDRTPEVVVMRLTGEIDRDAVTDLQTTFAEILDRHRPERVALDMSRVTFLDSAGLRTLLTCRRMAATANSRVEVALAHDIVRQVLTITGLLDVLNVAPADGL
ncbi:STAS domain-containing protein [Actinoplanes subglobosus]|uniref:Anti-sigma factor antagonist n=1 Tax=Actinoplanes subglobosus TaxID=1547892 RepID=A0ABV8IYM0_9ACTN